jgi:hypothetical protein
VPTRLLEERVQAFLRYGSPRPLAGEAEAAHEMGDCTKPTGMKRSPACRACHRELQLEGPRAGMRRAWSVPRGPIPMAAGRCCLTGAPAPGHHARPTEVASCFAEWAEHPGPREARLRQRRATAFVSRRPRRGEDRKAFASGHGGHGYTRADLSASCPERPRTCLSPDRLGPRDARRMKPTW